MQEESDPNSTQPGIQPGDEASALPERRRSAVKLIAAVSALAIAAASIAIVMARSSNAPQSVLKFDWPADEVAGATVSIDGAPITVPSDGRWEWHGAPGIHHVFASRPAYVFETELEVRPGQTRSIKPKWKAKSTLLVRWPPEMRDSAVLSIDGDNRPVSKANPLKIPLEPGEHSLKIVRPGYVAFERTIKLSDGERSLLDVTLLQQPTSR